MPACFAPTSPPLWGIGLPLDEPFIVAQHCLEMTAAQIQAAFAKWLRPDDLVQVTQVRRQNRRSAGANERDGW